jgi:nicotinate phosphoribosyltransferase
MNKNPTSYLFSEDDLHLYDIPQIFAASTTWFESGMKDEVATFDLYVRDMPAHRNFLLFGGLDEIIQGIQNWRYSEEEIQYLLEVKIITPSFAEYLKNFEFTGSVWAMPEGTVFFNNEPVVRITAPIVEANLFTMFLMNVFTGNTKILSKIIRSVVTAKPKKCIGLAGLRADSFEYAMKGARAAYIAGAIGSGSVPSFARKFGISAIQPLTNAYHAVIKSFPSELEAMRKMAELFNGKVSLTVDTYDFEQGVRNAIIVAKELQEKNKKAAGIFIDSGNLLERCAIARRMLNEADLQDIQITIATNLDEYKIKSYIEQGIVADNFLVATELTTVSDSPRFETVYKLAEIIKPEHVLYCAKFSPGKETYPGKKQVFRTKEGGMLKKDIVGLDKENLGEPLLVEIFKDGKLVYQRRSLDEIRAYVEDQITQLPPGLLMVDKDLKYDVSVSSALKNLFELV